MKEYEYISDNCKMLWKENFDVKGKKYTQVSCYALNDNNELLIVKNKDIWTIPGGHPEKGETKEETLVRELMEEGYVTLKDIHYLGTVEVVENNEIYYQLRYTAHVESVLPFKGEYEISERKFVNIDDLSKYIKWANGITFKSQLESVKEYWNI